MTTKSESEKNVDGQKKAAKVKRIIQQMDEFIEYVFASHYNSCYYQGLESHSEKLAPFQKLLNDEDIYFLDPSNIIIEKYKILIESDPYTKRHFYYKVDNDKIKSLLHIAQDPASMTEFIPNIVPIFGRLNLVEDYGKIESIEERKPFHNCNREFRLGYSWGVSTTLEKKKYSNFVLDFYPDDPKAFQEMIIYKVRKAYWEFKNNGES